MHLNEGCGGKKRKRKMTLEKAYQQVLAFADKLAEFNPYHDKIGRFTTAEGNETGASAGDSPFEQFLLAQGHSKAAVGRARMTAARARAKASGGYIPGTKYDYRQKAKAKEEPGFPGKRADLDARGRAELDYQSSLTGEGPQSTLDDPNSGERAKWAAEDRERAARSRAYLALKNAPKNPRKDSSAAADIPNIQSKSIAGLAAMAAHDMRKAGKVPFGAKPYLDAMYSLDKITDQYHADSGESVVAYFLANAAQWRGPVAKAIKAELNKRLKRRR